MTESVHMILVDLFNRAVGAAQRSEHDHALHAVTFGPDGLWYFNHGNAGAQVTDRSGRTFRVGYRRSF